MNVKTYRDCLHDAFIEVRQIAEERNITVDAAIDIMMDRLKTETRFMPNTRKLTKQGRHKMADTPRPPAPPLPTTAADLLKQRKVKRGVIT